MLAASRSVRAGLVAGRAHALPRVVPGGRRVPGRRYGRARVSPRPRGCPRWRAWPWSPPAASIASGSDRSPRPSAAASWRWPGRSSASGSSLVNVSGIFLASAVPYYRGMAIALIGLSLLIGLVCLVSLFRGDVRRGLLVLTAVAVCLKIAHWGYYVPEWNYRHGQGPWGRAIGQWVVPDWPIYTVHAWPRCARLCHRAPVPPVAPPQEPRLPGRSFAPIRPAVRLRVRALAGGRPAADQGRHVSGRSRIDPRAGPDRRPILLEAARPEPSRR